MNRPVLALAVILAFVPVACAKKDAPAAKASSPAAAEAAPAAVAAPQSPATAPAPPPLLTVSGTVEETFGASDYTYMRLKTKDGEIWAAVTKAAVKKGESVTVVNAARMDGFESKTMNRKFDRIVFGSLGKPGESPAAPAAPHGAPGAASAPMASGHLPAEMEKVREQMAAQHAAAAAGPVDVGRIDVKKAEGADGKTVAELFAQKAALKEKEVAVRGKVVKFTPGVMGKNWIHLRDGSGTREMKNDDITITTAEKTAIGEVVLVRGTVRLDRDFGAGYAYPVLIENAKLAK